MFLNCGSGTGGHFSVIQLFGSVWLLVFLNLVGFDEFMSELETSFNEGYIDDKFK